MLKFMRNKVVGIERKDEDTLQAYGVLEDDIYAVELEVSIGLSDMVNPIHPRKIQALDDSECPKAIRSFTGGRVLRSRRGFFQQKVQKKIGRKGCRHFANLLVECCATAEQAAGLIRGRKAERVVAGSKGPGGTMQKEAKKHPEKSFEETRALGPKTGEESSSTFMCTLSCFRLQCGKGRRCGCRSKGNRSGRYLSHGPQLRVGQSPRG